MEAKKQKSFVQQATILAVAGFASRFLGFIFRLIVTRMIGDEGNGIYGISYYLYTFFLVMSSAGLPNAISKMVSERLSFNHYEEAHKVFKVSMLFAGAIGLLSSLVLFFGVDFFTAITKSPRSKMSIMVLAPTVFIVSLVSVYRGYFQGMNNTVPTAFSQIVEQIVNVIVSIVMTKYLMSTTTPGGDAIARGSAGAISGTMVGGLAALLVMFVVFQMVTPYLNKQRRKDVSKKPIYSEKEVLIELLKTAFPIVIGTAVFSISNLIDAVMVKNSLQLSGNFTDQQIEALYGQLTGKYTTVVTLPVSISTSLATAALPTVAASYVRGEFKDVKNKINSALRITMMIAVPAAVGIGVLADPIIRLLFPSHPTGSTLLQVGSISVVFLSLAQISTGLLQAIGSVGIPVIGALMGTLIKIPLNYFLVKIPSINVIGAVIATMACNLVASGIDMYFLTKRTGIKTDIQHIFIKPALSAGFMGLICYIAYNLVFFITKINAIATLIAVLMGVVSYVLFMILFKGLKESDVRLLPYGNKLASILFG